MARPDNIVAWRSLRPSGRGGQELADAFKILLGGSKPVVDGLDGSRIKVNRLSSSNGMVNGVLV